VCIQFDGACKQAAHHHSKFKPPLLTNSCYSVSSGHCTQQQYQVNDAGALTASHDADQQSASNCTHAHAGMSVQINSMLQLEGTTALLLQQLCQTIAVQSLHRMHPPV
jgi:hypothetical protein